MVCLYHGEKLMADQSAPRKTRTMNRFSGMNTQDERYGCQDDEFFWMENLMRVGDGKLHTVPGPSAVLVTFPIDFLLLETGDFLLLETGDPMELDV